MYVWKSAGGTKCNLYSRNARTHTHVYICLFIYYLLLNPDSRFIGRPARIRLDSRSQTLKARYPFFCCWTLITNHHRIKILTSLSLTAVITFCHCSINRTGSRSRSGQHAICSRTATTATIPQCTYYYYYCHHCHHRILVNILNLFPSSTKKDATIHTHIYIYIYYTHAQTHTLIHAHTPTNTLVLQRFLSLSLSHTHTYIYILYFTYTQTPRACPYPLVIFVAFCTLIHLELCHYF